MKSILICFFLLTVYQLNAQTTTAQEAKKISRVIERNLKVQSHPPYAGMYDLYIYSISLTSDGAISYISILTTDSSAHLQNVKELIPLIKKEWTSKKTSTAIVYIPVIIVNPGYEDDLTSSDKNILETINLLEVLSSKKEITKVYLSPTIYITTFSTNRLRKE